VKVSASFQTPADEVAVREEVFFFLSFLPETNSDAFTYTSHTHQHNNTHLQQCNA